MSININEMTVSVAGNVVKNMSADGKSTLLRMTEDQAASIYADLGGYFQAQGIDSVNNKVVDALFGNTGAPPTPVSVLAPDKPTKASSDG